MFRCIVSADLFRRAYECVSNDLVRYYLNGVRIEAHESGGALLIATDGRRLVALRDPDAIVEGEGGIVSANRFVLAACHPRPHRKKARFGRNTTPSMAVFVEGPRLAVAPRVSDVMADTDRWSVCREPDASCVAFQWHGSAIDGTFPDWRKVVPTTKAAAPAPCALNPDLLGSFRTALCAPKSPNGVTLTATGTESFAPLLIHGDGCVDGFGVLMPMRVENVARLDVPSWGRTAPILQAAE